MYSHKVKLKKLKVCLGIKPTRWSFLWCIINAEARTLGTKSQASSPIKTQILARWFLLVVVKDKIIPEQAAPRQSGLFGSGRVTPNNGGTTQTNTPALRTGNWERSLLINRSLPNGFHLFNEYLMYQTVRRSLVLHLPVSFGRASKVIYIASSAFWIYGGSWIKCIV